MKITHAPYLILHTIVALALAQIHCDGILHSFIFVVSTLCGVKPLGSDVLFIN